MRIGVAEFYEKLL